MCKNRFSKNTFMNIKDWLGYDEDESWSDIIFSRPKTDKEILNGYSRSLQKMVRRLTQEKTKADNDKRESFAKIEKAVKSNNHSEAKVHAKQFILEKQTSERLLLCINRFGNIANKMKNITLTNTMVSSMGMMTRMLSSSNVQLPLEDLKKIIDTFEKQNKLFDMKDGVLNDSLDDVFKPVDNEDEKALNQVISSVELKLGFKLKQDQIDGLITETDKEVNTSTKDLSDNDALLQERVRILKGK